MNYTDKIVWITGASSGIGEALTHSFAKRNATIIISGRRMAELERVKQQCNSAAEKIHIVTFDVSNTNEINQAANQVIEKFGKIDILINNAGVSQRALVKDAPIEIDRKIMEINFFGTVALTKAILPFMISQQAGKIIVISSLAGKLGTKYRSAYAASKHALHGFFDSLRCEVWQDNIQVLLVCPGYIKTNISFNAITADGSPQNKMDEGQANGMLPEVLSEKIIKAMENGKEEVAFGGSELIGLKLKRFFPGMLSNILKKRKSA